jgi:hypothetical protein
MKWLYFKLYGNVSCEPKQLYHFTPTGERNIEQIERQVAHFLDQHEPKIKGFYVTRYPQDSQEQAPLYDHVTIPEHHYSEFIRLRFRVDDADYEWALDAFQDEVIAPLEKEEGCLKGWRFYEGYEARGDVGARFGDLPKGIDPTEEIVAIMTGFTRLRFYLLDHPDWELNHDLMHLYCNTMGLLFPEEMAVMERLLFAGEAAKHIKRFLLPEEIEILQECAAKWRDLMNRVISLRSPWLGNPQQEGVQE